MDVNQYRAGIVCVIYLLYLLVDGFGQIGIGLFRVHSTGDGYRENGGREIIQAIPAQFFRSFCHVSYFTNIPFLRHFVLLLKIVIVLGMNGRNPHPTSKLIV